MNCKGNSPIRQAARFSLVGAIAVCLLYPAAALARSVPKGDAPLSSALAQLAKPPLSSASHAKQARILGIAPSGPGSLLREGNRVLVGIRFDQGAIARLSSLKAAGARVLGASRRYQTVTAAVAPTALGQLSAVPGIASVTQDRAPIVYGTPSTSISGEESCEGGSVISEGVSQLNVDKAREKFALRGKGVTVGVLSDSFDAAITADDESGPVATHAHEDVESNDLPGLAGTCSDQQAPVDLLEDDLSGEGKDEGRAMLQIVHDIAPHASLAFATAFLGEESFARNIERLASPVAAGGAGAEVIADDVAYLDEPFFQDGPVAAAVNKVSADGVTYLSAAGNDNLFEGENEIASWEAPEYQDSGECPVAIEALGPSLNGTHCMDFDPGVGTDPSFEIGVEAGATLTIDLQWAEPWYGVNTDLDAFLLNSGGQLLAESVEGNTGKNGTQKPFEILQWENESSAEEHVNLAINRFSGGESPRLKFALLENGAGVSETEYPKSVGGDIVGPTIFGHAGSASAIAVAAVPFRNSAVAEKYSSRGPVTHYFAPVEGAFPAAALGSPETIAKPDVAATDCSATTFFAHRYNGVWRFCGTSAAAPHAAAVAALLRQANPLASASQIRTSLTSTAVPVGSFGADAVGSGLIDARAALESLPEPIEADDGPSVVVPALEVEASPQAPPAVPNPPAEVTVPKPPNTFFRMYPQRTVFTRGPSALVVFRFSSNQTGVSFLCRVDRARFRPCPAWLSRRYAVGPHVIRVKARNTSGEVDATPAVFHFRVKPVG